MIVDKVRIYWQYDKLGIGVICIMVPTDEELSNEQPGILAAAARVSDKDQYCKETGRRVSLTRLLKKSGLSKEARTKIWEAYRTMTKVPRWNLKVKQVYKQALSQYQETLKKLED